jgi:eukaryotic-like serine/threonine-protein kinase
MPQSLSHKPLLGRYQLQRELGRGTMGVVYLGLDRAANRYVAVKTICLAEILEEAQLDEIKSRLFQEAETIGRLHHPNIVAVYEAGDEHDLAYIGMEYLEGTTLAPYIKKNNLLPVRKTLFLVATLARALDYAHRQQVAHRDIKPRNVMYAASKNTVKITDFGIASVIDAHGGTAGLAGGTPFYMSPEQVLQEPVDGRSDLFSLGVMLYQLATGSLPFTAGTMDGLMHKIVHDAPISLFDDCPALARTAPYLGRIMDKALKKSPSERYQRGAEMARDLLIGINQIRL